MQTDRSPLDRLRNDREPWRPRPTLGGADYTSPEVYQQEREKIWWGDWVCAGCTEEVSNAGDSPSSSPGDCPLDLAFAAPMELRIWNNGTPAGL